MKSFDKVWNALTESAEEPWNRILQETCGKGEIMMCLRWHYDNSIIVRIAVQNTLPSVLKVIHSGVDGRRNVSSVTCHTQVKRILCSMKENISAVKNTPMEDVARAAADLLCAGIIGEHLVDDLLILAVQTATMDTAVRTCMSACACKFTELGVPISAHVDEDDVRDGSLGV